MCGAEAFEGSVLGDSDYLSILTPETGTIGFTCPTWYSGVRLEYGK